MNSLKNSSGFSIIQVIVAAAIMGGLSLALLKITQQSNKSVKGAKVRLEEEQMLGQIFTILSKKENCEFNFGDSKFNYEGTDTGNGTVLLGTINGIYVNGNENPIYNTFSQDDQSQVNKVRLNKLSLYKIGDDNFELKLKFLRPPKIYGHTENTRTLPVNVILSEDGTSVKTCFSDKENTIHTATVEACEMFSGTYDEATSECTICDSSGSYCSTSKEFGKKAMDAIKNLENIMKCADFGYGYITQNNQVYCQSDLKYWDYCTSGKNFFQQKSNGDEQCVAWLSSGDSCNYCDCPSWSSCEKHNTRTAFSGDNVCNPSRRCLCKVTSNKRECDYGIKLCDPSSGTCNFDTWKSGYPTNECSSNGRCPQNNITYDGAMSSSDDFSY